MDNGVELYLKEINKVPDLTKQEELQIVYRVLKDDHEAAERLAESNMKRVAVMAMEYQEKYNEIDLLDLIQAGNTGLLRAVQSYTPGEYRFWEYAAWWVRKEIEEFVKKS
jgi:RNA polymerase primary sigma factor